MGVHDIVKKKKVNKQIKEGQGSTSINKVLWTNVEKKVIIRSLEKMCSG